MISGTFHISSQEWRYFSREKAIIHTAHLAQLPSGTSGETVLIDTTSPAASSNNNFSVPPVSIPSFPGISVTENITVLRPNRLPDVFGSVGRDKTILAQKNVEIQFAGWSAQSMQFYIIPKKSGLYLFYIQIQGDPRDATYQGPIDPTLSPQPAYAQAYIRGTVQRMPLGFTSSQIAGCGQQISMEGQFAPWGSPPQPYFSASTYDVQTQLTSSDWALALVGANLPIVWTGSFLGNAPDAQLTGYMYRIQDLP